MCRTQGIVAVLLQDPHLALLRFRKCTRPQKSIVMMDACTAKYHVLSVNCHSNLWIVLQKTNSKGFFTHIVPVSCLAGIQIGMRAAPEFCLRYFYPEYCHIVFRLCFSGNYHVFSVADFYIYKSLSRCFYRYFNYSRAETYCTYPHSVKRNMLFFPHP